MDDKQGTEALQGLMETLVNGWNETLAEYPEVNDLVCIVQPHNAHMNLKFSLRETYLGSIPTGGLHDALIDALRQPAGDESPTVPRKDAIWVLMPVPDGISVMRVIKTEHATKNVQTGIRINSQGGSA